MTTPSGLQISYNVAAERHKFHIPHGTLILWVISCAQICYGFTMRPDSLSHGYKTWIAKSIKIPPQTVEINDGLVREARMDVGLLDGVIALPVSSSLLRVIGMTDMEPVHPPCELGGVDGTQETCNVAGS